MTTPARLESVPIEGGPITFLPDGAVRLQIDHEVYLNWRPPHNRQIKWGKDLHMEITEKARKGLLTLTAALTDEGKDDEDEIELQTDPEVKAAEAAGATEAAEQLDAEVEAAVVAFIKKANEDLNLNGDLPDDVLDWPPWLSRLPFVTEVVRHWGRSPFVLKSG
ncbi:MAG: hypothetical protein GY906_10420 [bacterium]|nr:hypothetical protein [bacterium]